MTARPKDLPEFDKPPVHETVFDVQFTTDKPLNTLHLGQYWQIIRQDFPKPEERAPLPPLQEWEHLIPQPASSFALCEEPPVRRCWFLDESGNRIIQVQPDRFAHNWRKVRGEESYPRYEVINSEFLKRWTEFAAFLEAQGLGKPKINLAELSYVNHIEKDGCWSEIGDALGLFSFCSSKGPLGFLPKPENFSWDLNYRLPEKKGRLYISVRPAIRTTDGAQIIQMSLTVRGPLEGELNQGNLGDWFKLAREWIVKGFTDATTNYAHTCWKRSH